MENNIEERIKKLEDYSKEARLGIMEMFAKNQRGGLGGSLSIVDLYVGLYLDHLSPGLIPELGPVWDRSGYTRPVVIPKGTSSLALYSVLDLFGVKRKNGLQDYGSPDMPPILHRNQKMLIDATSASLGLQIGYATGQALSKKLRAKNISHYNNKEVICFIGDGEMQEGVDQAAKFASRANLDNLCVVVDCNRMQSCFDVEVADPTMERDSEQSLKKLANFWNSLGWATEEINGHDFKQILPAYEKIGKTGKPLAILANTNKGKGISFLENGPKRYKHKLSEEELKKGLEELRGSVNKRVYTVGSLSSYESTQITPYSFPKSIDHSKSKVMQDTFVAWLKKFIELDKRVYTINTDHPWIVGLDAGEKVYSPSDQENHHIFPGLNERLSLQVAKGLAEGGLCTILGGPCGHMYSVRDEWRSICMDKSKVLVVGNKPGTTLQHWGPTHTCYDDLEFMANDDAHIFQPATHEELLLILNNIHKEPNKYLPAYLRLPEKSGNLFPNGTSLENLWSDGFYSIEMANILFDPMGVGGMITKEEWTPEYHEKWPNFQDSPTIITSGDTLSYISEIFRLELSDYFKEIKLINLFNLTSFNKAKLQQEINGSRKIISLTEATPNSLLNVLFDVLTPHQRSIYTPLGIKRGSYGNKEDVYRENGIDSKSIVRLLGGK